MKKSIVLSVAMMLGFGTLMADAPATAKKECPNAKEACKKGKPCPKQDNFKKGAPRKAPGPMVMRARPVSYLQFLPTAKDVFPKEFAEAQALGAKDKKAAFKKMMEINRKFRQQKMKENKPIFEALKIYKEKKDEAKLAEAKKLIAAQVDVAFARAKAQKEAAQKELDSIRKLNISKDKAAAITRIYDRDIKKCDALLKSDKNKIVDSAVNAYLNPPPRKFRAPGKGHGKGKFPGRGPAKKADKK